MITRHHGSGSCGGERGKSMELISWRELRSNFDAFGFGDNTLHLGSNICVIHNFSEHYQKKKRSQKQKQIDLNTYLNLKIYGKNSYYYSQEW